MGPDMVDAVPKRRQSHGAGTSVSLLDALNLEDQGEHIGWPRRDTDY
jgi:hypothetical protein